VAAVPQNCWCVCSISMFLRRRKKIYSWLKRRSSSVARENKSFGYLKSAVFWDITQCGPCRNRHFGGT
jgi:hypothetical protein